MSESSGEDLVGDERCCEEAMAVAEVGNDEGWGLYISVSSAFTTP